VREREEVGAWACRQGAGRTGATDGHAEGGAGAWRPQSGRPVNCENAFSFLNQISDFSNSFQIQILRKKETFSQVDPKTKVVQNLILYNFGLGHFFKFPTDFELMI
jgi:hypothetical protein